MQLKPRKPKKKMPNLHQTLGYAFQLWVELFTAQVAIQATHIMWPWAWETVWFTHGIQQYPSRAWPRFGTELASMNLGYSRGADHYNYPSKEGYPGWTRNFFYRESWILDLLRTTQRTESLKFKTESVLKKYLIVPAYLNFRNDLNVVLNFSVDIIRFRHQS